MRDGPVRHLYRHHHSVAAAAAAPALSDHSKLFIGNPPTISTTESSREFSPSGGNRDSAASSSSSATVATAKVASLHRGFQIEVDLPCLEPQLISQDMAVAARRKSLRSVCASSPADYGPGDCGRSLRPRRSPAQPTGSIALKLRAESKCRRPSQAYGKYMTRRGRSPRVQKTSVKRRIPLSDAVSNRLPSFVGKQRKRSRRSNEYPIAGFGNAIGSKEDYHTINKSIGDKEDVDMINESSIAVLGSVDANGNEIEESKVLDMPNDSSVSSHGSSNEGEMEGTRITDHLIESCKFPDEINGSSLNGQKDSNEGEIEGHIVTNTDIIRFQEEQEVVNAEASPVTRSEHGELVLRQSGIGTADAAKKLEVEATTISHWDNHQYMFDEPLPYLPGLDDESALRCLASLPLCEVGRLVGVNKQYRDLVEKGVISQLRHGYGLVEQWVFIYTSGPGGWSAYSPKHNIWKNLPPANVNPIFDLSDRESLSVGTQVLWLGREAFDFVYYRYDILTNLWEKGPPMANPRWLFAWATCDNHQFAFVAGGYGPGGPRGGLGVLRVLDSAERYNSLTGQWESLPPMSMPRQKCSGFFMDGKFYVIGGKDANHRPIFSGEEYNPTTKTWRLIENMYFEPANAQLVMYESSPPLVAVVNNQLYAVDNTINVLKMYDKVGNTWIDLDYLPVRTEVHNGWGVAFKAVGDRLFVMGDMDGITAFSWQPKPDAIIPDWKILSRQERGENTFLLNCAVMVY